MTDNMHDKTHESVLERLGSTQAGLSTQEATRRLSEYGPNRLPEPPRRNPILRFLAHFHNVLIYVLLGSSVVTALLGHWVDTGVILAVVIGNAIIGFVQEGRAEQAMAAIREMLAPRLRRAARREKGSVSTLTYLCWVTLFWSRRETGCLPTCV